MSDVSSIWNKKHSDFSFGTGFKDFKENGALSPASPIGSSIGGPWRPRAAKDSSAVGAIGGSKRFERKHNGSHHHHGGNQGGGSAPRVPYDDPSTPLMDPNTVVNENNEVVVTPRLGQRILESQWTIWFFYRAQGVRISNYEAATKRVCTFATVEEFWSFYGHLKHVDKLPYTSEFQVFRRGIKPMWEDSHNVCGGKWVCRLRRPSKQFAKLDNDDDIVVPTRAPPMQIASLRHQAAVYWEKLLLALVGGTLLPEGQYQDEIVGAVISVRKEEDIISVWNRTSNDPQVTEAIRAGMQAVLGVPESVTFEYKVHSDSLKEGVEKQALYETEEK
ncbi:YALIA101S02e06172g1_1 [Yarrowia lipolytica]|nr:Eukaryotic translation initiation factor 4E type 2 [Yarrowia lipolytica]SEI31962.1 YALIA101S02e06172g1_1 [Yarrowia lipolytica]